MTGRIERRFAALEARKPRRAGDLHHGGRSGLRHRGRAPQGAAQSRRRYHRARHAVHRSDGRRPGDPGGGSACAQSRGEHEKDARRGARIPRRRRDDAARPDGLLQSDLCLRRRYVFGRCQGGRRRRAHRGRSAARGGRRIVPAGARGRRQFHPACHADDRRQAAADGAHQYLGLRLLRLDHRHYRRRGARPRQSQSRGGAHQAPHQTAGLRRLRRAHARSRRAPLRKAPTASWSARRWSMRCAKASDPTPSQLPAPSLRSPASSVRWPMVCAARNGFAPNFTAAIYRA